MNQDSDRVFAVVSDAVYFPGVMSLLNSIWAYHRKAIPVVVFEHKMDSGMLDELGQHPLAPEIQTTSQLSFPPTGTWEAKQQVFAQLLPRWRTIMLLDADLVLVSNLDDIFRLAEAGKIVSGADGPGIYYADHFGVYDPSLPGTQAPHMNTAAVCFDARRHWDLAGLWAFSSQYGAYSPHRGVPIRLPGHGDQGLFNAIACQLRKEPHFHILQEEEWNDSTIGCTLRIQQVGEDRQLTVMNEITGNLQRLCHCAGPKWWTPEGISQLDLKGDKLEIFRHFAKLFPGEAEQLGQTAVDAAFH
jgi:hypothetical protein